MYGFSAIHDVQLTVVVLTAFFSIIADIRSDIYSADGKKCININAWKAHIRDLTFNIRASLRCNIMSFGAEL